MHEKTLATAPSPARRRALPALLEPLRHRRFRQLWLANLAANLGRWVQAFAAAWLVASMSDSTLLTTLVQTASYAPMLLFALPAGVLAAFSLPALRARLGPRRLLAAALLVFGVMLAALPLISAWPPALALVLAGGMAWAAIVSTLNGRAQTAFPPALRARTISIYMLAMGAGQSAGALFWGMLAERMGVAAALLCAAVAMCACVGHVLTQAHTPAAATC